MSFSSLALVAGFLTSHWTEVVTYFGGTFCIESWFLDIVPEAAVLSVLGCFFSDSYHPFLSSWPMCGDNNNKKNPNPQKTTTTNKSDPCRRWVPPFLYPRIFHVCLAVNTSE